MGRKPVRVAVDAMGGDYAPREIVKGAIQAAERDGIEVILVGSEDAIQRELEKYDISGLPIRMVNTGEVIREGESPVAALRLKPDASIMVATRMLKEGEANTVVSMGYTGAVMVTAIEILGKLEGIKRPSVGGLLCGFAPSTIVFDMGSNADCKPRDLLSFAVIGSVVAQKILHINNPTVALLSNGSEEGKGNLLVKKAYPLFKETHLNFIGNIEGYDIPFGRANVVVCDGFTGNVLIKFCEGLGDSLIERLRVTLDKHLSKEELDALVANLFTLTHVADVNGGGMIYGVNGVVWIGHGHSKAPGVTNAIQQAKLAVEANLIEALRAELMKIKELKE
jgi:glycerol-3-phosphate acyltransferase PlsX